MVTSLKIEGVALSAMNLDQLGREDPPAIATWHSKTAAPKTVINVLGTLSLVRRFAAHVQYALIAQGP
jgi:hypothetical protein